MATGQLGSLSIQVLADIAQMVSDLGKAQEHANKFAHEIKETIEESGEKIKETFAEIGAAIGLTFSIDKTIEFGKQIAEQSERVRNLSESLGVSVQSVQALGFAAALTGGSIETVSGGLEKLERSAVQAAGGNKIAQAAFDALGVSVLDAQGKVKSSDELFEEVAQHLSQFADGPQKTAVAMQLMGRGAAEQIPFLNELGQHTEELRKEAEELGVVMSGPAHSALLEYQEATNLLDQEVKGLGNTFMAELAPSLTEITARMNIFLRSGDAKAWAADVGNAAKNVLGFFDDMSLGATVMIAAGDRAWNAWKTGIQILVLELKRGVDVMLDSVYHYVDRVEAALKIVSNPIGMSNALGELRDSLGKTNPEIAALDQQIAKLRTGVQQYDKASQDAVTQAAADIDAKRATAAAVEKVNEVLTAYREELAHGTDKAEAHMKALRELDTIEQELGATGTNAKVIEEALGKATDEVTSTFDRASAKTLNFSDALAATHATIDRTAQTLAALQQVVDQLGQKTGDEYQKAWAQYEEAMTRVVKAVNDARNAHADLATVEALEREGFKDASQAYEHRIAILNALKSIEHESGDVVQQLLDKYKEEEQSVTQGTAAHERVTAELAAEKQMRDAVTAAVKAGHPEYAAEIDDLLKVAKAHADETIELKKQQQELQEWQGIATSGFNSVGSAISTFITSADHSWKNFGQALVDDTKKFVAQIIEELLKLELWNRAINAMFGTNLPTGVGGLMSMFGGGSSIAGASGSAIAADIGSGLNADVAASIADNGGGVLAMSAQNAMSGATNSINTISTSNGLMGWLFGSSYSDLGGAGVMLGQGSFFGSTAEGAGGYMGYLGDLGDYSTAGGAAVPAAQSSLFSQIGPTLSIASAALAGYNEFQAAGGGAAGVAGGLAYGIGTYFAGAAATAAVSAGVAGGVSAGLAAGMAAIPVVGWIALAAMAVNMITGGGLFGTAATPYASTETVNVGANAASVSATEVSRGKKPLFGGHYYETQAIPVPTSATDAISSAFDQLHDTISNDADLLGTQAGALVQGSFKEVWDKNGKMTSQVSTVLGQQYKEDLSAFWERMTADNMLALLPASQNAQKIAEGWQADAKMLLEGTQMLVAAQLDINRGMGLLGDADTSLGDITKVVTSLQQSGESLSQTYARLQAEQNDLANTLAELGLTTGRTGADFVKFSDQLANAAGGLQNLDKLWADFFKNFYTSAEQSANSLAANKDSLQKMLSQIGESADVSMAQFRQDFTTKLPTLSASEVVEWLSAAEALAAYTKSIDDSAAALAAAKQKYADYEVSTLGSSFVQSMVKVVEQEKAQIDSANQLAIAAGNAGASQRDLAYILGQGSAAMGQAIANLTTGIVADINKLFASRNTPSGNQDWDAILSLNNGSAASSNAQIAAQAAKLSTGYDLIQKIGDFAFASGISVADALKTYKLSANDIAQAMGTTPDKVTSQIESAKASAASLVTIATQGTTMIGLTQDLLAQMQGKPLPFDPGTLVAPNPITGGKIGPGNTYSSPFVTGGAQPADHIVAAITKSGTKQTAATGEIVNNLRRMRAFGNTQRNTRGTVYTR